MFADGVHFFVQSIRNGFSDLPLNFAQGARRGEGVILAVLEATDAVANCIGYEDRLCENIIALK